MVCLCCFLCRLGFLRPLCKRRLRCYFLCRLGFLHRLPLRRYCEGVLMIYMDDEYGLNYFRWDKKEESSSDFFRFCRLMTTFRQECELLGLDDFPTSERLQWHGHFPGMLDWSETSRFVACTVVQ
ncbi:Isoamylase 1 [Spatholobus suberectus]|nr:Isoamylase 1 [Spatholobus suberectus]